MLVRSSWIPLCVEIGTPLIEVCVHDLCHAMQEGQPVAVNKFCGLVHYPMEVGVPLVLPALCEGNGLRQVGGSVESDSRYI